MDKRYRYLFLGLIFALMIAFISSRLYSCQKNIDPTSYHLTKLDTIYAHGLKLYSQGKVNKAIKALELILKEAPQHYKNRPGTLRKLKKFYAEENNLLQARDVLRNLVYDYPDSKDILEQQKELESLNMKILFSPIPTGESTLYEVRSGDTLSKIAKEFNTTAEFIRLSNNLISNKILAGRNLRIWKGEFGILIDVSQNALILKSDGDILKKYVISTGKNNSTPLGKFKIEEKLISPLWYKIGAVVSPDSPEYELGSRWMGISEPGYGIHGTADESTIGGHITNGCVRMRNEDIEEIFAIIPQGTIVEIIE